MLSHMSSSYLSSLSNDGTLFQPSSSGYHPHASSSAEVSPQFPLPLTLPEAVIWSFRVQHDLLSSSGRLTMKENNMIHLSHHHDDFIQHLVAPLYFHLIRIILHRRLAGLRYNDLIWRRVRERRRRRRRGGVFVLRFIFYHHDRQMRLIYCVIEAFMMRFYRRKQGERREVSWNVWELHNLFN